MPSTSGKQHRAMEAAKHGNSTLGIPPKVGADFVAADQAAGKKFGGKKPGPEHAKKLAHALRGGHAQ